MEGVGTAGGGGGGGGVQTSGVRPLTSAKFETRGIVYGHNPIPQHLFNNV